MLWTTGQQLQGGKYVIEKVLGKGGFGITYKALQLELNRPVVIKIPDKFLSHDPEYEKYVERFIKEGRILARLSQDPHPHIVGVIDLFPEGNTHCLVMEFVEGENLFEAVRRRGALPEAEILPCICQIAEALIVVHKAGLVHRDAHPGNIMLGKDGNAVLIDFGIAKGIEPQTLTSTGDPGNKGFVPYEQIIRDSRHPTVDVYCLAATLYYAVTGKSPEGSLSRADFLSLGTNFRSRRVERVIKEDPLIPPKQINPDISKQLNQAILEGMALEAEDRPQSMQEWLEMLKAPKITPPPPVKPVRKTEFVRSQDSLKEAIRFPDREGGLALKSVYVINNTLKTPSKTQKITLSVVRSIRISVEYIFRAFTFIGFILMCILIFLFCILIIYLLVRYVAPLWVWCVTVAVILFWEKIVNWSLVIALAIFIGMVFGWPLALAVFLAKIVLN